MSQTTRYMPRYFGCCNTRASRTALKVNFQEKKNEALEICRCGNIWNRDTGQFETRVLLTNGQMLVQGSQ